MAATVKIVTIGVVGRTMFQKLSRSRKIEQNAQIILAALAQSLSTLAMGGNRVTPRKMRAVKLKRWFIGAAGKARTRTSVGALLALVFLLSRMKPSRPILIISFDPVMIKRPQSTMA
jgi:hypothetical protein